MRFKVSILEEAGLKWAMLGLSLNKNQDIENMSGVAEKLAGLPVVLVTALSSREDREHGMDVGANAYIIKDTFNPEKLLEIVKKLE